MSDLNNRRPIASRSAKPIQTLARRLAKSNVTPNQISQVSIGFAVFAGLMFFLSGGAQWVFLILAALGIQGRLMCNLLDGMVAVEGGKAEADGPFWNEAPDRYADIAVLVGLGYGLAAPGLGWAAACAAVLVAYTRELGTAQGLDPDFSGPFAKQHRMAALTGAAVLAIFLPQIVGFATLKIALLIIAVGSLFTALKRSWRMIEELRNDPLDL
ncbi:CDP-alcohol phosphatidyltransferase family protein [Halocynthiibacter styelae]|uniref:CDP-alcohol phosphatidyltransferase family protein n=1 Tax=Halocynthiibacter styelae TaxID=2761955 RepID=A0A8J7IBW4_9RHOB|nr:CDP-alcohol phosphatidyltransferase family protein [Paenihalocynthiibacter styelae]MBI1492643.1 CDP-alcohol phosphatidyltransferase family protein [Paenihalocynthiibacter styelae]